MLNENENKMNDGEANNFGLPEGYFQKSAQSIMNRVLWQEEHKRYSLLSQLKDARVFGLPTNYFDKAENKAENLAYPKLLELKKNPSGFTIPDAYFEEAEVLELTNVMNEEEPVLAGIPKLQAFVTPDAYFEKSGATLLSTRTHKKRTKIFSLFPASTVMAAAAVLLITLGWWTYDRFITIKVVEDCGTIACIDRMDLLNTKAIENLETEDLYELVNSSELEEKLNNTDKHPLKKTDSANDLSEEAMDDLLDGI